MISEHSHSDEQSTVTRISMPEFKEHTHDLEVIDLVLPPRIVDRQYRSLSDFRDQVELFAEEQGVDTANQMIGIRQFPATLREAGVSVQQDLGRSKRAFSPLLAAGVGLTLNRQPQDNAQSSQHSRLFAKREQHSVPGSRRSFMRRSFGAAAGLMLGLAAYGQASVQAMPESCDGCYLTYIQCRDNQWCYCQPYQYRYVTDWYETTNPLGLCQWLCYEQASPWYCGNDTQCGPEPTC